MKLLLHMCCGPCAYKIIDVLKEDGFDLHGLFYNPNIHPYTEYKKRLESAQRTVDIKDIPLIVLDEYRLDEFLRNSAYRENIRCKFCYSMRLERAASVAQKGNFDFFTSTLLISPYQKHELIKEIGEEAAVKYKVDFYYKDFRSYFKEGLNCAREEELYMQQYCGCIYSERDRYIPKYKKINL